MPGMSMAHGGETHHVVLMHAAANLLPEWLGVAWTIVFLVIAASHLRHMVQTTGQRRPWHACHVLMAIGMAFMYAPTRVAPIVVPAVFWQTVFAASGVIAAAWAIGGVGRVSVLVWLLTSIDFAVMLYMWSGLQQGGGTASVTWAVAGYLIVEAMMWALDLYRRLDGAAPIVSWRLLAVESGNVTPAACGSVDGAGSGTLLGELDISASMIAMTVGMAYMLVAMQLMR